MPCETMRKRGQTAVQRKAEVKKRVTAIDKLIAKRKVGVKVGPQGAITFTGISEADRDSMTDICIYRQLMITGSSAAKMAIATAETLAGRRINQDAVKAGIHSHDGGATWHPRG